MGLFATHLSDTAGGAEHRDLEAAGGGLVDATDRPHRRTERHCCWCVVCLFCGGKGQRQQAEQPGVDQRRNGRFRGFAPRTSEGEGGGGGVSMAI